MEDFWEEIFGEKEAVFLELLSSCRFPPASLSIGEVASADLGGLFPRGRARDGNAHPEVLELGPSAGVLLGGHGVAVHFGVALVVEGKDCLVETAVEKGEKDDDEGLKGALEADFDKEPLW